MTRTSELDDPGSPNGAEVLTPTDRSDWRRRLASHPRRRDGLWVVYRKKSSSLEGPSPRRPRGVWSALNKKRIERLVREGLMAEAGQLAVDGAVADGSWTRIDEVDSSTIPSDLSAAFDAAPQARAAYEALTASAKKQYLWWICSAKRPATRASRIAETIRRLS